MAFIGVGNDSGSKRGRESCLIRQSYLNKSVLRPGSSHHGRIGVPDTFTPPWRNHSSKKSKLLLYLVVYAIYKHKYLVM